MFDLSKVAELADILKLFAASAYADSAEHSAEHEQGRKAAAASVALRAFLRACSENPVDAAN